MIKTFIKVIREETLTKKNPFYGKVSSTQTLNDEYELDKDEREEIAPHGISLVCYIHDDVKLSIEVSKHHLNYDADNWFDTTFVMGSHVFELEVKFDDKGKIKNVVLRQWLCYGDFEDGEEPDYAYYLGSVGMTNVKTIDM